MTHGLAAVTVCAALSGACATSTENPVASAETAVLSPPDGLGLQPVLTPDFSTMGTTVAEQMRDRYAALAQMVRNADGSPADLAGAYGEMGDLLLAARELECLCQGSCCLAGRDGG